MRNNRETLIDRCKAKVALRPHRAASVEQLSTGVPLFLDQLIRTLEAEEEGEDAKSLRISGASGGDTAALSEVGVTAAAHGRILLELGFTVDQVVHDYGDLCQAITDLAVERDAPFAVDQFRTLNRCLDNAIADAVAAFCASRDATVAAQFSIDENQRIGFLVHELRNHLLTATLAFSAIESGKLAIGGSTAGLVKRSLASLATLLTDSVSEVKSNAERHDREVVSITSLVTDAAIAVSLLASAEGKMLTGSTIDPTLSIMGNRGLLVAALMNLLQNAFKFTRTNTAVTLTVREDADRILIDVQDCCGGLPAGHAEDLFKPFTQAGLDKSGLGLGLAIARRNVETDGGRLGVRDIPGTGCVFTIDLPRHFGGIPASL